MSDSYDLFETDDPDQMADEVMSMVREVLLSEAYGEREYVAELLEELEEKVRYLAGAD
jgi:hypothetical protein